tara:strand:+ start:439 stop:714 length:276 start_codon:yes stop_codon:yes gene_type:complete
VLQEVPAGVQDGDVIGMAGVGGFCTPYNNVAYVISMANNAYLLSTIIHEIGHLFGALHVSSGVMHAYLTTSTTFSGISVAQIEEEVHREDW